MDNTKLTTFGNNIRRSRFWKKIKKFQKKDLTIFASIPPGFSESAKKEAQSKLNKIKNLHTTKGGISFIGTLHDVYKANLLLGIPSRILVRIDKFEAQNFKTLTKKIEQIPFELFLYDNRDINIKVSARKSRLIHTGAIKERVLNGIIKRLKSNESILANHEENPDIYIRLSNDMATVSIDSSGRPLYKRGLKKFISKAPLRENYAHAALLKTGYNGSCNLFDPMCGSGTFSIEGLLIKTQTPPGLFRDFSFKNWPSFNQEDFEKIIEELKQDTTTFSSRIFASDIDFQNLYNLGENLKNTNLKDLINRACIDFFHINPKNKKGVIAINPPYGKRIKRPKEMLSNIEKKLKSDFKGSSLIYTIPREFNSSYFSKKNFDEVFFLHGGIEMKLVTGVIF